MLAADRSPLNADSSSDLLHHHIKEDSHPLEAMSYRSVLQPLQSVRGVVQCYFCAVSRCYTAKPGNGVLRNVHCVEWEISDILVQFLASVQKSDLLPRLLECRVPLITLMNQNRSAEHGFPHAAWCQIFEAHLEQIFFYRVLVPPTANR